MFSYIISYVLIFRFLCSHTSFLMFSYFVSYVLIHRFLCSHTSFLMFSYFVSYILIHRFLCSHISFLIYSYIVSGTPINRFWYSHGSFLGISHLISSILFVPSCLCGKKILNLNTQISHPKALIIRIKVAEVSAKSYENTWTLLCGRCRFNGSVYQSKFKF